MSTQEASSRGQWPKILVGSVLLWRAMCAVSLAELPDLDDHRLLAAWSSPGLNRCVRLTFAASGECATSQMTYAEVSKENENVLGVIQHPQ